MKEIDDDRDNIWSDTISVLEMIHGPNITNEAEQSKKHIWEMIEGKTSKNITKKSKFGSLSVWLVSVAATVLIGMITGIVAYTTGYNSGIGELTASMVEVNSPMGVITNVSLPDGSKVTLNGGSKLSYPTLFADNERKVLLDGEGFFEVTADAEHPFLVSTTGIDIKVLGTKFSLRSYYNDNQISVTLAEGSVQAEIDYGVEAKILTMKPNQQLIYNRVTGEISKSEVDANEGTAWRNGDLYFRNIQLEDIARQLERKFDVIIKISSDDLRQRLYFCQFDNDESLDQILSLLSYKNNWEYTVSGKEINISEMN